MCETKKLLKKGHLISLVEDDSDLVVLSFEGFDGLGELIGNVQFVGVKQQDDPIHAFAEPTQNLREVITCRNQVTFLRL